MRRVGLSLILFFSSFIWQVSPYAAEKRNPEWGRREQEYTRALIQKYYELSGLSKDQGLTIKTQFVFTASEPKVVYRVSAQTSKGVSFGPSYLIERGITKIDSAITSTEVKEHRVQFPDRVLGVFAKVPWDPQGIAPGDLYSLNQLIVVPFTEYDDKLRMHLSLVTGFSDMPPVTVAGRVVPRNNGWQFPWWSWSLTDPELIDLDMSEKFDLPLDQIEADPKQWIRENGEWVQTNLTPIALLNEDGSLFSGKLDVRDLLTVLPRQDRLRRPQNPFQRHFYSAIGSLPENESELADWTKEFAGPPHPSGVTFQLEIPKRRKYEQTVTNIHVESLGLTRGDKENPNHLLVLKIDTLSGLRLNIGFQNNLPNLIGRSIYFGEEWDWLGHVQVRTAGESDYEGREFNFRETPVKGGLLKVESFETSPKDGFLTQLRATIAFVTGEFRLLGKTIPSARGFVTFDIPAGSLERPYTHFASHDIGVSRQTLETQTKPKNGGRGGGPPESQGPVPTVACQSAILR